MQKRVYLDTEYCYPGMKRGQPRPTSADRRQIVQIAAVIFDNVTGQEFASFDQYVVPRYEPELPEFFIALTGISQADVDVSGIRFDEALARLSKFCGSLPIWTFDKDEEVLRQNCGYDTVDWPFKAPFTRVKELLPDWRIDPDSYSSGTLYQAAGLDMDGHVHNALHDVRSMAHAVHVLEN